MIREWMAMQTEANKRMKDHFKYLENIQQTKSLPCITNIKLRHGFVYKLPSIRNENDNGDVKAIEEDAINLIPTMPNPSLINSNSSIVLPFREGCIVHIPYTNAKMFADDVLPNHVGDEELNSIDGVGNERTTKKKIKKNDKVMPKEPNKEWKLNEKVVPHNEEVYHYQWYPTEIPHLNCIIKES
nr:hypothetical protein [Tanacetum cinerariifolium]